MMNAFKCLRKHIFEGVFLLSMTDMEMKKEYTNKEIILEIVERANEDQLEVIKDLIVAVFPDLEIIDKYRKEK